jgi:hypothetical protein
MVMVQVMLVIVRLMALMAMAMEYLIQLIIVNSLPIPTSSTQMEMA